MGENYVFVVQVALALTLQTTLSKLFCLTSLKDFLYQNQ